MTEYNHDSDDEESEFDDYVDVLNYELDDDLIISTQQMLAQSLLEGDTEYSDSSDLETDFASNYEFFSQEVSTKKKKDAFNELRPSYTELTTFCDKLNDPEITSRADELIRGILPQLTREFHDKLPTNKDATGNLVSSNVTGRSQSASHTPCRKWG